MFRNSVKKLFLAGLFVNGLLVTLPSAAEFVTQYESAEADAITVQIGHGKHSGTVTVTGCDACPLELDVDAETRFFSGKKEIHGDKIGEFSGQTGTAIYRKDDKRAFKVLW